MYAISTELTEAERTDAKRVMCQVSVHKNYVNDLLVAPHAARRVLARELELMMIEMAVLRERLRG
jgi:hypothetical protein